MSGDKGMRREASRSPWTTPVAEFIDSDWGYKVKSGKGLGAPARQATWAGGPLRPP